MWPEPTDGGICAVDVWESRTQFDQFMQERFGEQRGRVGVPEPEVTEFEVHNSQQRA